MDNLKDTSSILIKGSFWSYLGVGVILLFGFLTNVALARLLDKDGWGIFTTVVAFVSLLTTIVDLGFNYTILFKTSRLSWKNPPVIRRALGLLIRYKLIMILFMGTLIALAADPIASIFNISNGGVYFLASAVFFVLFNILGMFESMITGLKFFKESTYVSTINTVLRLVFAYVLVVLGFGISGAIAGFVLALVISVFAQTIVLRKYISLNGKLSEPLSSLFSYGFYFGLASLSSGVLLWTDSVIIGLMMGATSVGFYKIAMSIAAATGGLIGVVNKVIFPVFSRAEATGQDTRIDFNRAIRYGSFFAVPAAVGLAMSSDVIVNVFFGTQYAPSIGSLIILSYLSIDLIFTGLLVSYIAAKKKVRVVGELSAMGAIANVILNIVLISMFGLIGAAIASVLTRIGVLLFLLRWADINLGTRFELGHFTIPLISSAIMAAVLYVIRPIILVSPDIISTVAYIGIGVGVYLTTSQLLGFDFIKFVRKGLTVLMN